MAASRDAGAALRRIESEHIEPGGEFLVGLCGGRLVVTGGIQRTNGASAKVRRMRTDPGFQRRGFG